RNYLSKTLHRLAQTGLLVSVRGPGGGFQLAQPPEEIPLRRVVEAVEPPDGAESRCLLGRARCNPDDPCAAHARWCEVTERVDHFFGETMLADITSRVLDRDT
ncbi:MAG: Rrf2 family transcriptional regulator, partial [Akkermansiaceae bacterium]|nr:Rrf2 family transcriptional regulator [Akkermansiaceae bacterium]